MIRPGSLDVLPDCLDYGDPPRTVEPETGPLLAIAFVVFMLAAFGLGLLLVGQVCPLWIIHGAEGRLLFAC